MPLRPWHALALTFAAYIACIYAGYIWDDEALVVGNTALTSPTLRKLLGSDLWCCSGTTRSGYWRPLTTLSFYADVALFGFKPAWGHLHSLGWHLACVGLLARLVGQRHGPARGAVAAVVFGLHPVLSEAIIWIAARNDLLAAAFVLATLIAVDARRPLAVALCALCALLSKESSALLPALAMLWVLAHDGARGLRGRLRELCATFAGLAAALALRQLAELGTLGEFRRVPLEDPLAGLYAVARLFGWIAWPWPLTATATLYLPPPGAAVWVPAAITLAAAVGATVRSPRLAGALLAFTLLSAAPMAVALAVYGTIGERYLYLPLVGVATLLAVSVPATRPVAAVGVAWVVGALALIHVRLLDWVDPLSFFEAAVRRAPDSYSWDLYGAELARRDDPTGALDAFTRSLTARPTRRFACLRITHAAVKVLDLPEYLGRVPTWRAAGCSEIPAFEYQVAWHLAELGGEREAVDVVQWRGGDHEGVSAAVVAAAADREGDILGAAFALDGSDDVAQARSRFGTLRALRTREWLRSDLN